MHDHQSRRKFLEDLLRKVTPLILEAWTPTPGSDPERTKLLGTKNKTGFSDLVTIYDQKVEIEIKKLIGEKYESEIVIGEESSTSKEDTYAAMKDLDSFWIVDPIDGTTNYSRAYPFFSSTIAWVERINEKLEVVAGATLNPVSGELFSAHKNGGATLNGQPLKVSNIKNNQEALFATGFVSLRKGSAQRSFDSFVKITEQSLGVRRDGSAALDLAFVSAGRLDAYWEKGLSPWDMATGSLLVREAGGLVTKGNGQDWDLFDDEIISSNSHIHEWIQKQSQ